MNFAHIWCIAINRHRVFSLVPMQVLPTVKSVLVIVGPTLDSSFVAALVTRRLSIDDFLSDACTLFHLISAQS